jgi:hypothetical protein
MRGNTLRPERIYLQRKAVGCLRGDEQPTALLPGAATPLAAGRKIPVARIGLVLAG